jgi:hypothetical protein
MINKKFSIFDTKLYIKRFIVQIEELINEWKLNSNNDTLAENSNLDEVINKKISLSSFFFLKKMR